MKMFHGFKLSGYHSHRGRKTGGIMMSPQASVLRDILRLCVEVGLNEH